MKVDFYVIDCPGKMQALARLCQLLEQPYAEKKSVFINATTDEEADLIDKLLWTYREDSFLAHELAENADATTPIVIGCSEPDAGKDILINLQSDIPAYANRFKQIFEFVFKDNVVEQLARERYRKYRDQGHELNTHKLKAN